MNPELKLKILTVGFGLFSIIFLCGFIYSLFLIHKCIKASFWPRVDGRVLRSRIIVDDSDHDGGVSYSPDITYSYCVKGMAYTSETVYLFSLWQTKRSATFLTNKYQVNDKIEVRFNPDNPKDSVLITGMSRLHLNALIALIFMLVAGVYFLTGFVQGLEKWI